MARPRGLSTYLRLVSKLRRMRDPVASLPVDDAVEDRQRAGDATTGRPIGPLVWVHATDADDARWLAVYLLDLVAERGEDVACLLTTERPLSIELPPSVLHQIAPTESGRSVARFLDHWTPDLGIFLNAPDRPVLISAASDRQTPLFLAATRRAETAARPRLPILNAAVLECFTRCLAASVSDAEAFRKQGLSGGKVEVTGPLTDIGIPLECDPGEQDMMRHSLAGRPVWLAAGLAAGEVPTVEAAHREALRALHRLFLIMVPGDGDTDALISRLTEAGWQVTTPSGLAEVNETAQIMVASDVQMGLWLRLASITLVGGSLTSDLPARDPFEAALLGSVVVHGPLTAPHTRRFERLHRGRAALELRHADELGQALQHLLAPDRAAEYAHAGWSVTSEAAPVIDRLVTLSNLALDGEVI